MKRFTTAATILAATALFASIAQPALAGPPLVCFPFDIGGARSLPWEARGHEWKGARADYDLAALTGDTLALLTPATPVVVRMETLRRAAIYASGSTESARQLLAALRDRTKAKGADPLASFDLGYLVETYRQLGPISKPTAALVSGLDGAAMVEASVRARPTDPGLAFAAAMVTLDGRRGRHATYALEARAGRTHDQLLARNLDRLEP